MTAIDATMQIVACALITVHLVGPDALAWYRARRDFPRARARRLP